MVSDDSPGTVLVVDDDQGLLRLIEKTLCRIGHRVITVVSADVALASLELSAVDLVLLDLGLPNLDGRALASQLATRIPRVPFVVITGLVDVQTAVEVMKLGAIDYVMKDAQFIDFLPAVIKRALTEVERESRLAGAEEELRRLNAELEQRVRDRTAELEATNQRLHEALAKVKTLTGVLPTCAHCKKIRCSDGFWHPIELYISERSQANFSHGLCPDCLKEHYADVADVVLLETSQSSKSRPAGDTPG